MTNAVREARSGVGVLKDLLKPGHTAIGSIDSPMQCMLKEVCSQCLQRHVSGNGSGDQLVFSCFNQDQPLDCVDFRFLRAPPPELRRGEADLALGSTTCSRRARSRSSDAGGG